LFLTAVADDDFQLVDLTTTGIRRAAELVQTYGDMPLGTTDATVIALAERIGVRDVATLDRRHFSVVRPSHVEALTLLRDRPRGSDRAVEAACLIATAATSSRRQIAWTEIGSNEIWPRHLPWPEVVRREGIEPPTR
jgi:uncharacterized protein